mgnify:CR=1 FL=1
MATPTATIERQVVNQSHQLNGYVAGAQESFRYTLSLTKKGPTGISQLKQSGRLNNCLKDCKTSEMRINIVPGDHYEATLEVYSDTQLIVTDRLVYPEMP